MLLRLKINFIPLYFEGYYGTGGLYMINKLIAKIEKTKAPIVIGLDPMLNYIPKHIQKKAFAKYGETLEGAAEAIWQFNKEIVDKTWDLVRLPCMSSSALKA